MDENIASKCAAVVADLRETTDTEFNEELLEIREKGIIELIPFLVEYVKDEEIDRERRHKVLNVIADVTSEGVKPYLLEAIQKLAGTPYQAMILSTLWQSRLNFVNEIEVFVELMFAEDYYAAIEAATVIENTFHELTDEQKLTLTAQLRTRTSELKDKSRKHLIVDLLKSLE